MARRPKGLPGTCYVDEETARLALAGHCPICGTSPRHRHDLDVGELAEVTAVGQRGWSRG